MEQAACAEEASTTEEPEDSGAGGMTENSKKTPSSSEVSDVSLIVNYLETHDESVDFARKAIRRIEDEGLDPIPECYAVWYNYYAGTEPDLNQLVDLFEKNARKFTTEEIARIYLDFFGTQKQQRNLDQAGEMVQSMMGELMRILDASGVETTRYSEALETLFDDVNDEEITNFQLRALVDEITQETRKMLDTNKELSTELTTKSQAMNELQKDLEKTREEVLTDPLTGIPNRKSFELTLSEALQNRAINSIHVLMIDIDRFKQFNDKFGHQVGDNVLKFVGNVMMQYMTGNDMASRYGGEEFAILLLNSSDEKAIKLANTICDTVASQKLVNKSKNIELGTVTLSVGVTQKHGTESILDTVARADAALYDAKNSGRNRVVHRP